MAISRWVMLFCFLAFAAAACTNNPQNDKAMTGDDSSALALDSADMADDESDSSCINDFFRGLPRFPDSASAMLTLESGKAVSLTQFFKDEFMSPVSQYGKKDLDGDGRTELVIFNYTGGAHCCDEFYIFDEQSPGAYRFRAHLVGGHACIDPSSNTIVYSFSETLGYFFSCYACNFPDSAKALRPLREINLRYNKGSLQVLPYDSMAQQQNVANLAALQRHGYEPIDGLMDNGWRKEYAMNLAVWYYNNGKNLRATRKIFDTYYPFPDAGKVWNEFQETLRDMRKENTF